MRQRVVHEKEQALLQQVEAYAAGSRKGPEFCFRKDRVHFDIHIFSSAWDEGSALFKDKPLNVQDMLNLPPSTSMNMILFFHTTKIIPPQREEIPDPTGS